METFAESSKEKSLNGEEPFTVKRRRISDCQMRRFAQFFKICTISKNVKNTHGGVLFLVKLQTSRSTPPRVFSRFLNCLNGNKSRKESQMYLQIKVWHFELEKEELVLKSRDRRETWKFTRHIEIHSWYAPDFTTAKSVLYATNDGSTSTGTTNAVIKIQFQW